MQLLRPGPGGCLDFASLFLPLRAHNICWTTLRGQRGGRRRRLPGVGAAQTPEKASENQAARAAAAATEALITTRRRTKALAKAAAQRGDTNEAECLQARRSLKLCANASYGFTGPTSRRWGARPRRELRALGQLAAAARRRHRGGGRGRGSPLRADGLALPLAGPEPRRGRGGQHRRGRVGGAARGPDARARAHALPFLLLHVNRYAGRDVGGEVVIKGAGSAPGDTDFVRSTLKDATASAPSAASSGVRVAAAEQLLRGDGPRRARPAAPIYGGWTSRTWSGSRGEDEDDSTLDAARRWRRSAQQDPGLRSGWASSCPWSTARRGDAEGRRHGPSSVLKTNAVDLKLYRGEAAARLAAPRALCWTGRRQEITG